jgi:hypothetical protein
MKNWLLSVILLVGLAIPFTGQAQNRQDALSNQIKYWTQELSSHDSRFIPLTVAALDQESLDANSQKWLVTFRSSEKVIGYMVCEKKEDGFLLLEYGLGNWPIFDRSVVSPFLSSQQEKLNRHYSGLESVWSSNEGIYDAKSGEKYPAQVAGHEHEKVISNVGRSSTLQAVLHKDSKNSLGWLKPKGTINTQEEFFKAIQDQDVSFLADLFDGTVKAPFTVTGYHIWNGDTFIELKDYGSRFVPYSYTTSIGSLME